MRPELVPLPWQQAQWLELTALSLQKRLGHAWLFSGPRGVGKRAFARALTAFLLCESPSGYACGRCRSCEQLLAGTHPNASLVSPDGHRALALGGESHLTLVHWQPKEDSARKDISIHAARSLIEHLSLSSHYGQAKLAVIDPADLLNAASANALLKTIEEPRPGTHLLLVTERPQSLPATLRSRCQRLRFVPPREAEALEWLQQQVSDVGASALAEAYGAPLLALQMAQSGQLQRREEWQSLWLAVARRKRDPLSCAGDIGKDDVPELLQWAMGWLTTQLREALRGAAAVAGAASLASMLEQVGESQRRLAGNANAQLLLESLLIEWARLTRPG